MKGNIFLDSFRSARDYTERFFKEFWKLLVWLWNLIRNISTKIDGWCIYHKHSPYFGILMKTIVAIALVFIMMIPLLLWAIVKSF